MRTTLTIARREFASYFTTPIAGVFLVAFLVLSVAAMFFYDAFFVVNEASLRSYFYWLPFILASFVPAVAMRQWCEERRLRTLEWLLTMPVRPHEAILGKYLGGLLFLILAQVLVFPLVITVGILGSPDWGAMACGFIGCFFVSGALLGVCTMLSSAMTNQVACYVLGAVASIFWVAGGHRSTWEFLQRCFGKGAFQIAEIFSLTRRFEAFQSGVLVWEHVGYFVTLTVLFLTGAWIVLSIHRWCIRRVAALCGILGICFGLTILSACMNWRWDMTADNRFTLSAPLVSSLKSLSAPVTVDVYETKNVPGIPASLQSFTDWANELLDQMVQNSDGRLTVRRHNPLAGSEEERRAVQSGVAFEELRPGDVASRYCFGICFRQLGKPDICLRKLRPMQRGTLEYDLVKAMLGYSSVTMPKVGIVTRLPLFGGLDAVRQVQLPQWGIVTRLLECGVSIEVIDNEAKELPKDLDALLVIQPPEMTEAQQEQLAKFVQEGHPMMICLDSACWTEMMMSGEGRGRVKLQSSNLKSLLGKWGVVFQENDVVLSPSHGTVIVTKDNVPESHIEWLSFKDGEMNPDHSATRSLKRIECFQTGYFDVVPLDGMKYEPLLSVCGDAQAIPANRAFRHQQSLQADYRNEGKTRVVALELSGVFPGGTKSSRVIVLGDVDGLHDSFADVRHTENQLFFLNCMDVLLNRPGMVALRSHSFSGRPLEYLEAFDQRYTRMYQARLEEYQKEKSKQLALVNQLKKMNEDSSLTDEEGQAVQKLHSMTVEADKALRDMQVDYQNRRSALQQKIIMWNLLACPALFLVLVFIPSLFMRDRRGRMIKGLAWSVGVIVVLGAVLWGVARFADREQPAYRRCRMLEQAFSRDALSRIELTSGGNAVTMERQNGVWCTKETGGFPVEMTWLNGMIETLLTVDGEVVPQASPEQLKALKLDDGSSDTIRIYCGKDVPELTLHLGAYHVNYAGDAVGRYVRLNDGRILMVSRPFRESGFDAAKWNRQTLPGTGSLPKMISRPSELKSLAWELEKDKDGYVLEGKKKNDTLRKDIVESIVASFASMRILSVVLWNGMEFKPLFRIEFIAENNMLYSLTFGEYGTKLMVHIDDVCSARDNAAAAAIKALYAPFLMEVNPKVAKGMMRSREDLLKAK